MGTVMVGGGGAAILNAFRTPLGSAIELLSPSAFAGPGGMPLVAEIPAPAEPAFGVPTGLWASEDVDIPTITISATADLIKASNTATSFGYIRMHLKMRVTQIWDGSLPPQLNLD
jgi:hypothetical protein